MKIKFSEILSGGLGRCNKMKAKFNLKENVGPVFKKKSNVPFASLKQINDKLDWLEKMGVLSKVDYSDWASPTVHIKKKSKERCICADFSTGLNNAHKNYHYPLPRPEEVFAQLSGVWIFSKIDLSNVYLQIKVDDKCSKLLTINTHRDMYKFNLLAFGIKVTPSYFSASNGYNA